MKNWISRSLNHRFLLYCRSRMKRILMIKVLLPLGANCIKIRDKLDKILKKNWNLKMKLSRNAWKITFLKCFKIQNIINKKTGKILTQ